MALRYGKKSGEANFKTNLRYPVERVLTWGKAGLEEQMKMACMFKMAEVIWFEYAPVRVDERDWIVFEVTGRNYVPLPDHGTVEQIKDALL